LLVHLQPILLHGKTLIGLSWNPRYIDSKCVSQRLLKKGVNKAKSLQWLLTHSFQAKLLAARRVTRNRGSRTAGVDGKICRSNKEKMQLAMSLQRRGYQAKPLRRVYIPKKSSSTERRPLSIPTIDDRVMQALHLLALEPIMEINADPNAYGFRPKRSTVDAIEHCFHRLSRKTSAQFILEGDIRKCFDRIDHQWLQPYTNG
jgi:RNA-directed DNA polymerase